MATATRMTNQQQSFFASHAQQEQQAEKGDNNPLETLKYVTQKLDLCDENGIRKKDRHWTFAISIVDSEGSKVEMNKVRK